MIRSQRILIKSFFLFLLALVLVFTYYFYRYQLPLIENSDSGKQQESTLFEADETSFVDDPDFGLVPGINSQNGVATEFWQYFHFQDKKLQEPIENIYSRYKVISLKGNVATVVLLGTSDEIQLPIKCDFNKTALFKRNNMEFVSSNFDILKVMKWEDLLFTKCESKPCTATGAECILLR